MDESVRWVGSMPEVYERCLAGPVFRPFARELARRAAGHGDARETQHQDEHAERGARPSRRVLELAAGTGVVTRELLAALGDAEVTATDLNPAMVELAASRVPGARWQVADATCLPFPDAAFDLVVCGFGVMFLPDKPAAYAEVGRVLAPGGRFAFTSWDTLPTHGFGQAVVDALEEVFPGDVPPFLATVPHGYADPARITEDLHRGGFGEVDLATVTLEGSADTTADLAEGLCAGTPLRAGIEQRLDDPADLDAVVGRVAATLTAELGPGPVTAPMTAHVVVAYRDPGPEQEPSARR